MSLFRSIGSKFWFEDDEILLVSTSFSDILTNE
jgi:hypothetical protein